MEFWVAATKRSGGILQVARGGYVRYQVCLSRVLSRHRRIRQRLRNRYLYYNLFFFVDQSTYISSQHFAQPPFLNVRRSTPSSLITFGISPEDLIYSKTTHSAEARLQFREIILSVAAVLADFRNSPVRDSSVPFHAGLSKIRLRVPPTSMISSWRPVNECLLGIVTAERLEI